MKKSRLLALLLAVLLIAGSFPAAASAEEMAEEEALSFGSVCILNGCRTLDGMMPLAGSDRRAESAQSVVIYEKATNTMIYSYNPDAKMAPGGLSKILNALITIEHCPDLDEVVTVQPGIASRVPAGGMTIKLKSEEELTVNDLLHCMILQSANDAAIALAEHVAGTQTAFLDMMNNRVKQIGCGNTVLANVHGLDNKAQYTTARDLARIVQECTQNETFCELFACQSYTVPATNMSEQRKFASQNYLMETTIVPKYNDQHVTGGFASYSANNGASIVCTATTTTAKKVGLDLVVVLMGATRQFRENGWSVTNYGNFEEVMELLEWTYTSFKPCRILYEDMALKQFPVSGGESDVVGAPKENQDGVLPVEVKMDNLFKKYSTTDGGLSAPIKAGDEVSTVEVWYQNSCLMEAKLYALSSVKTVGNPGVTIQHGMSNQSEKTRGTIGLIVLAVVLVPVAGYLGINAYRRSKARERYRRRQAARQRSRYL